MPGADDARIAELERTVSEIKGVIEQQRKEIEWQREVVEILQKLEDVPDEPMPDEAEGRPVRRMSRRVSSYAGLIVPDEAGARRMSSYAGLVVPDETWRASSTKGNTAWRTSSMKVAPGIFEEHVLQQQRTLEDVAMHFAHADRGEDPDVTESVQYEYETVVKALETPSIYLIQAVRSELPVNHRWTLDLAYWTIVCIQVFFPLWFIANYSTRRRPLLISPGFHHKRRHTALRIHWFHNFAVDFMAAMFFAYLAWKLFSGSRVDLFRMFFSDKLTPDYKIHRPTLVFGLLSTVITTWSVAFMTYIRE